MEELFVSYVSHFIDAGTEEMLLRHLAVGAAVDERWDGTPGPQAPRLLMLREMLEWQGVTPESVQDALVAAVAAESGARDAAVTAAALATVGTTHDGDDGHVHRLARLVCAAHRRGNSSFTVGGHRVGLMVIVVQYPAMFCLCAEAAEQKALTRDVTVATPCLSIGKDVASAERVTLTTFVSEWLQGDAAVLAEALRTALQTLPVAAPPYVIAFVCDELSEAEASDQDALTRAVLHGLQRYEIAVSLFKDGDCCTPSVAIRRRNMFIDVEYHSE